MNNDTAADLVGRDPARYALFIAALVARARVGDLPGNEDPELFVARAHSLFDGREAPLLDAYSVVVGSLLETIAELGGRPRAVKTASELVAQVAEGDTAMTVMEKAQSPAETLRDIRLAVLGTARLLLERGSDSDIAALQRFNAELMLPEAMTLLCSLLEATGEAAETLSALTQQVLTQSLSGEDPNR